MAKVTFFDLYDGETIRWSERLNKLPVTLVRYYDQEPIEFKKIGESNNPKLKRDKHQAIYHSDRYVHVLG